MTTYIFSTEALKKTIDLGLSVFPCKPDEEEDFCLITGTSEKVTVQLESDSCVVNLKTDKYYGLKLPKGQEEVEEPEFDKKASPFLTTSINKNSEFDDESSITLRAYSLKTLLSYDKSAFTRIERVDAKHIKVSVNKDGEYLLREDRKLKLTKVKKASKVDENSINLVLKPLTPFAKQGRSSFGFFNEGEIGNVVAIGETSFVWAICEKLPIDEKIDKAFLPYGFGNVISSKEFDNADNSFFEISIGEARYATEGNPIDVSIKSAISPEPSITLDWKATASKMKSDYTLKFAFDTADIKFQLKRIKMLSKLDKGPGLITLYERSGVIELQTQGGFGEKGVEYLKVRDIDVKKNIKSFSPFSITDLESAISELQEADVYCRESEDPIYINGTTKNGVELNIFLMGE